MNTLAANIARRLAHRPVALIVVFATSCFSAQAHAGSITLDCAANVGVSLCGSLNSNIGGTFNTTFSNANASVYLQFGNTGLGSSSQFLESVSYNGYLSALSAHATDSTDAQAVAALSSRASSSNPSVVLTSALAGALGLGATAGTTAAGAFCSTPGSNGCYNGVITLASPSTIAGYGDTYFYGSGAQPANSYNIYSVAQHEVDEILGTISCGGTSGSTIVNRCGAGYSAATDLFRYTSSGTLAGYTTAPAYFSFDGGITNVASYNTAANGGDFGDFSSTCSHVQDAFGCPGTSLSIRNDGGPEITILDTIGYDLGPTPEPSSIILLGTGITMVAGLRHRKGLTGAR